MRTTIQSILTLGLLLLVFAGCHREPFVTADIKKAVQGRSVTELTVSIEIHNPTPDTVFYVYYLCDYDYKLMSQDFLNDRVPCDSMGRVLKEILPGTTYKMEAYPHSEKQLNELHGSILKFGYGLSIRDSFNLFWSNEVAVK